MSEPVVPPSARTKRTYGGVSGEERSRQRREKLLEAGLLVFGTLGYEKATMRDICAHARLAERYFYENFANIGETFDAVYQQLTQQLHQTMSTAMAKVADAPALDQAAAGLRAFYTFIKEDPRRAQIMLLDAPMMGHNNILQKGATIGNHAAFIAQMIRQRYPDLPKSVNMNLVTTGLIGLAVQTGITWYHGKFQESVDHMVEHNLYAWHGLTGWLELKSLPALQGVTAR